MLIVILVVPCVLVLLITFCVCVCFGGASIATYAQFFGYNLMNSQTEWLGKKLLAFPTAVNKYVKGGDLIFMEDFQYFDDYTQLNAQTLHVLKMTLRLKSDIMDFGVI